MNKHQILKATVLEIDCLTDNLTLETIDDFESDIAKYMEFLRHLRDLPDTSDLTLPTPHKEKELPLPPDDAMEESTSSLKEIYDTKNNIFIGRAHLLLNGGEFGSFKLYIPERYIRLLNIKEGDWIKANVVDKKVFHGIQRPVYEYEVLDRSDEIFETNREMIKYANVEYDDTLQELYIYSSYQEKLPVKIILEKKKLGNIEINEGDLVDYAYYKDNILNGKVVWRHQVDFELTPSPKKSSHYKIVSENREEEVEPIFEGIHVAVIGFESNKNSYREAIEKYSGSFSFFTGDEKLESLQSDLSDVDIIILFIEHIGHDGMFKVRSISKSKGIPILYSKKIGREMLVQMICDELNLNECKNVKTEEETSDEIDENN